MIPAKTILAKVVAANVVSHSYAPNIENDEHLQQFGQSDSEKVIDGENAEPCISSEMPPLTPLKGQL